MKHRRDLGTGLVAAVGLIILILDSKTAIMGAKEGLLLCLNVVIPSLFPFFVLSSVVNSIYTGKECRLLQPIGRLCGVPEGGESFLLLGLLGGYPVGAQCINEAYRNKQLDKATARRMLGFCNNAGPAFIFGMLGDLFTSKAALWCLWSIHILSAIIVGILLPGKAKPNRTSSIKRTITFPTAVEIGIKNIAQVCAWVILFRVILVFCQLWFLWLLPNAWQCVIAGILELSNGCLGLRSLPCQGLKYILGAGFISFGGLCVGMQTQSVTKNVGIGWYFPGKLLQTLISIILAWISQYFIFPLQQQISMPWYILFPLTLACVILYLHKKKKVVAIP